MTRNERIVFWSLAIAVAITRFFALSHSIWDWDEALFCSALRHYNVAQHNPHPPGFPLFIGMAKVARLFFKHDFHALRAVNLFFSLFVFPSIFALARSLRFPFRSAIAAALLFSFLPNVWYFGGTAFSDIPCVVFFLAGAALLLRDERRGSYLAGCALFACSMLIRPQNVLLIYPWLIASWRRVRVRNFRDIVAGAVLITAMIAIGYGAAAKATGFRDYFEATTSHQKYVASVDGSLNPRRAAIRDLAAEFFVDPFEARRPSWALFAFALIAFLRPRKRDFEILATFLPNLVLALFWLSPTGISRLSLGYIPMHALLAADGIDVVLQLLARRRERAVIALQGVATAAIVAGYIGWMRQPLDELRHHDSPPMAAIRWLQQHEPRGGRIYVQGGLAPFTDYYLARDYDLQYIADDVDPATLPPQRDTWYVSDHTSGAPEAIVFHRRRSKLWALSHRRYFDVHVRPVGGAVAYVSGWYDEEGDERAMWRWMGAHSRTILKGFGGRSAVELDLRAPLDVESAPAVTITFDGRVLDRFVPPQAAFTRRYVVASIAGHPHELLIDVDHFVNPKRMHIGEDDRDLGLQLLSLRWKAVPP
jgi:4-amino-4-deoxy-L-arabinose transferase-like glycosyltransferase